MPNASGNRRKHDTIAATDLDTDGQDARARGFRKVLKLEYNWSNVHGWGWEVGLQSEFSDMCR